MSDIPVQTEAKNVAQMTPNERMMAAAERAGPMLGPEAAAKLKSFLTLEAAGLAGLGVVAAAAQTSPIGWMADLGVVVTGGLLLVGAFALGKDVGGGLNALKDFVTLSRSAQTDQDLDKAAQQLAKGISTLGIDSVLGLALHKSAKAQDFKPQEAVKTTVEDAKATQSSEAPGVCIPCQKAAEKAAAEKAAAEQVTKTAPPEPETIVPDPGAPFQRNRLATEFYKENGKTVEDIMSHRDGIDMDQPVSVKQLNPGDTIVRWEFPGRNLEPGVADTYASYAGQDPYKMGIVMPRIDPETGLTVTRQPVTYKVTQPLQALESTAKDLPTPVGVPTVGGKGGALQLWIPKTAGLVKQ